MKSPLLWGATSLLVIPSAAFAQETPVVEAPTVQSVAIIGSRGLSEVYLKEQIRPLIVGKPATPENIRRTVDALQKVYRDRGFSVAQVVATQVGVNRDLQITVAEGVIRRIYVRGNGKTRTSTILEVLSTHPGDVYRDGRIRDDRDRLARLGIFEDVDIRPQVPGTAGIPEPEKVGGEVELSQPTTPPEPMENPDVNEDRVGLVDLVVRVRERRTGNIAATVGYADVTGLVGYFNVTEDNLFGTGQRGSAQWQRLTQLDYNNNNTFDDNREARQAYSLFYEAPALGARGLGYSVRLYDQNTIFQPFFGGGDQNLRQYERRRGGRVQVGREILPGYLVNLSARRDAVGYDAVPVSLNPPLADLATAQGTVGAYGIELVGEKRDIPDNPTRGYRWSVLHERAGKFLGGSRAFNQTTIDVRSYYPLNKGKSLSVANPALRLGPAVLAVRALAGQATGDVPLSEQFWIGGFDLLRGYDLYSIRGTRMLLTSFEGRVPLAPSLQGVVFTDFGNAFRPGEKVTASSLKAGGGVGLRFISPIGPIRLDFAYGNRLKTYVSLGQAF